MKHQPVNVASKQRINRLFSDMRHPEHKHLQSVCGLCHVRRVKQGHVICSVCEEDHGDTTE